MWRAVRQGEHPMGLRDESHVNNGLGNKKTLPDQEATQKDNLTEKSEEGVQETTKKVSNSNEGDQEQKNKSGNMPALRVQMEMRGVTTDMKKVSTRPTADMQGFCVWEEEFEFPFLS